MVAYRMREEGFRLSHIARAMHLHHSTVLHYIRQMKDMFDEPIFYAVDIRKFVDSIPHDVLLSKLEKLIHDEKFLGVLREIIGVTDHGLPLGFYTSQWLANWYLQELDHYI
jgi:retron-type reverse transcriptase